MKSSASRVISALLVTIGIAGAACSNFDTDPSPDSAPNGPSDADGGDAGLFPPVPGLPVQDSGFDTGRDARADADAAAWSPKNLPGLAVWLDSAVGATFNVNTKLTSWIDQSGNGNNATIAAPCVGPARAANSLNGHDTLAFTGSGTVGACVTIADATSLQFGTNDFAIFIVARYSNVTLTTALGDGNNFATLWKKYLSQQDPPFYPFVGVRMNANTTSEAKLQLWQNSTGNQATSATASLNDNTFRRYGGTRRSGAMEVWVNGASDASVTVATSVDVSQAGQAVSIGGTPVAPYAWLQGNIAEVVAVKGTMTDVQINQLDGYFKTKHGL